MVLPCKWPAVSVSAGHSCLSVYSLGLRPFVVRRGYQRVREEERLVPFSPGFEACHGLQELRQPVEDVKRLVWTYPETSREVRRILLLVSGTESADDAVDGIEAVAQVVVDEYVCRGTDAVLRRVEDSVPVPVRTDLSFPCRLYGLDVEWIVVLHSKCVHPAVRVCGHDSHLLGTQFLKGIDLHLPRLELGGQGSSFPGEFDIALLEFTEFQRLGNASYAENDRHDPDDISLDPHLRDLAHGISSKKQKAATLQVSRPSGCVCCYGTGA